MLMRRIRLRRRLSARVVQLLVVAVAAAAGVLAFGVGSAFASGSYTCTGVAAIDTPGLQGHINTGGTVTVFGPKPCVGNWTVPVSVTIQGGTPGATLNGNATGSVLKLTADVTLTVRNLTITNGSTTSEGGGIDANSFCGSVVNLQNALVTGNTAGFGGGVDDDCGTLNVTASTISNNTAGVNGGGIYVDGCGATVNITNSTVSNNTAMFNGGGIEVFCSTVNLTGATFSHNTATEDNGGGLDILDVSTLIATASSIISNASGSDGDGGGINAVESFVTLTSTSVNWNTAAFYGGGIEFGDPFCCAVVNGASPAAAHGPRPSTARPLHHAAVVRPQVPAVVFAGLDLESSTVEHNTAQFGAGGGIDNFACFSDSPVVINNSTVAFNRATGSDLDTDSGGGGYSQYGTDCFGPTTASLVATNSQFGGNLANSSVGGGIFNVNYGEFTSSPGAGLVTLAQTPVMRLPMYLNDNQAKWGGGIFNWGDGANTTLQPGSHVIHNQAFVNGGGVFNDCEATLTVAPGAIIAFNTPNQVFTNPGPCLLDD